MLNDKYTDIDIHLDVITLTEVVDMKDDRRASKHELRRFLGLVLFLASMCFLTLLAANCAHSAEDTVSINEILQSNPDYGIGEPIRCSREDENPEALSKGFCWVLYEKRTPISMLVTRMPAFTDVVARVFGPSLHGDTDGEIKFTDVFEAIEQSKLAHRIKRSI